ncbi:MAG: AMP-binding protein [Alphaproteobacteria bacterium]|nr:AMP-binding protein [Alphaproteobacteria bacterium]
MRGVFADLDHDRVVLEVGGVALTGRQLASACADVVGVLGNPPPGTRVAVWARPSPWTPVVLAANALAGLVSVPLNPGIGEAELAHVLKDAAPAHTVDPDRLDPALDGPALAPVSLDDAAPMLVLYTSGTTGPPKGAVLTRGNVVADLDGLAEAWAWTAEDVVVHALPLFHVHGLCLGWFGPLRRGGALRWIPRFEPRAVASALARERTMLFAVPTMHHRLAEAAEHDPDVVGGLRHARLLVSGSAPLPLPDHERMEALTGRKVVERYGLTETLIVCACRHDAPRPGTVGPAVPGIDLRLVADDGTDVEGTDAIGEVWIRGPTVFPGYLNRPDATAAVLDADGWFRTGDLATWAEDHALRIVGRRATDLIKTGGFKVGAGEVEDGLLSHPGVREAAVVGLPDEDLGQRIVAWVVPREPAPTEAELIEHVARRLAHHKRPREIRYVDALPRNAMGKVQKRRLG